MTVPITSDLDGYRAFWEPIAYLAVAEHAVIILLLVIIAIGVWRR